MAKKRKTTKQKAWAVVDRETGEVMADPCSPWEPLIRFARTHARYERSMLPVPAVAKVSPITITVHH